MQAPGCELLLSGTKTVETRGYPLPERLENIWLWLIETPGPKGKFKARIRGRIKFSGSFQYQSKSQWLQDFARHQVSPNDAQFAFKAATPKYGWIVAGCEECEAIAPPAKRGIVYARPFAAQAHFATFS